MDPPTHFNSYLGFYFLFFILQSPLHCYRQVVKINLSGNLFYAVVYNVNNI